MESGSKIGKLRQQGDQQIARGIAALAGPAQFHRRAVVRPFAGQVVRHEFMRLALPQRFVQPLGLLLALAGDQHPLAGAPAFGGNGAGHGLMGAERTRRFRVVEQIKRRLFH